MTARRLIIVGAGVAGSSAERIASYYGYDTVLVDPNPQQAASRAALATIRPQWLGDNGRAWATASWRWYERWGTAVCQTAMVSSWKKPQPVRQKDWWLVEPIAVLRPPDVTAQVVDYGPEPAVRFADGTEIHGDAVLVAVGAHDTKLYPDFRPMVGCTLYNDTLEMRDAPLRVHHLRPFHALTVAQHKNVVTLGSSIARTADKAEEEVWRMLEVAEQLEIVPGSSDWQIITNTRATSPQPKLPEPGNRVAVIGSLARSGYGIAPHVIEQWILSLQ